MQTPRKPRKSDLTYSDSGMLTLFLPETPAGESAWDQMAEATDGTGKVLSIHAPSVIAQLRAAGFTVRRAPKHKPWTAEELDAALAELDAPSRA